MDSFAIIRELLKGCQIVLPEQKGLWFTWGYIISELEDKHKKAVLEDKIENLGLEGLS